MSSQFDIRSDALNPYYDDFHFPSGFARSGYFSADQARLLTEHGRRLRALWLAEVKPATVTEQEFMLFCKGLKPAESHYETTWMCYLEAIRNMNRYNQTTTGLKYEDRNSLPK